MPLNFQMHNLKDQCHSILKKKNQNIPIWIKLQPASLKWNPKIIIIQDFFQISNLSSILKAHKSMPTPKLKKKKEKEKTKLLIHFSYEHLNIKIKLHKPN